MSTVLIGGAASSFDGATITGNASVSGTADFGTPTYASVAMSRMVLSAAQASTSGTSVDFTGIPSWVKRVTIMFNGVSTTGTSSFLVQLGTTSGVETTGYLSNHNYVNNSANSSVGTSATQGILWAHDVGAASVYGGLCSITTLGSNVWAASGIINRGSSASGFFASTKTLAGTLDRIRVTTTNGTDTFDAGSINIMYEG